jgi:hypothetical protein
MMKVRYIVCATCGREVDAVEADDEQQSGAVVAVMGALGMDEAAARKLVAKNNPGAELSPLEARDQLAEQIVAQTVPDRPADTYVCPDGHTDGLRITDDRPLPPAVSIVPTRG